MNNFIHSFNSIMTELAACYGQNYEDWMLMKISAGELAG